MTRMISARLTATSVGANMDLIESHRPFLRMAPVLLASRRSSGHSIHMTMAKWGDR